jgi:hypothetical protein
MYPCLKNSKDLKEGYYYYYYYYYHYYHHHMIQFSLKV